jgi:hypothetical protein
MKPKNETPVKKVQFICQAKGGSGKSAFTFMAAMKNPKALFMDFDEENQTTMKQVAFAKPKLASLRNDDGVTERFMLNDFFSQAYQTDFSHIICDMGASISEQLPLYFQNNDPEILKDLLTSLNIELELLIVVGGANIFKETMGYLERLHTETKGQFYIKVVKNERFKFNADQEEIFTKFLNANNLPFVKFVISQGGNEKELQNISMVMASGEGLGYKDKFALLPIVKALKTFEI